MPATAELSRVAKVHIELGTFQAPALIRWATWRAGRRGGYDSYVAMTATGPVVIDPEQPDSAAEEVLRQLVREQPIATVLTNDMHERFAYAAREQWGIPVWAPKTGAADLEGKPDHLYEDGQTLPGGLRAIDIFGRFSGDTVLLWQAPTGERVLFTGDTLCGQFNPDNPENADHLRAAQGLYLGAGPFYLKLSHPDRLKDSLRPLLDLEFDLICGAHGVPVRGAKDALRRLLALDWQPLLEAGKHPYVEA